MKNRTFIGEEKQSLFSEVSKNNYASIKAFLDLGYDINEHREVDGYTPLFIAVSNNNVLMLKFLLAEGADPAAKSSAGKTSLDLAVSSLDFNPGLVESLLKSSGTKLFQQKFEYYKLAREGVYNVDTVCRVREYLSISSKKNQVIPSKKDDDYDDWSFSNSGDEPVDTVGQILPQE